MATPTFAPVTEGIARELVSICGEAGVLWASGTAGPEHDKRQALLARYSHDQVPEPRHHRMPEIVVKPRSAVEVQAIVRLANRERIPVTPRGAGSGLSGGAIPVCGGILLCVERMNRILEVDQANLVAVVEPGVVTNALDEALKPTGLFFAGYPISEEICFIGGNVAHNAGGGRAVKYGVTRRYVTGLEVVTPSGDLLTLGGKRLKDATGYDLIDLMVGSEGTLGIFTRITLRLLPRPSIRRSFLALFGDSTEEDRTDAALEVAPDLIVRGGVIPSAIEYMDRLSFQAACRALKESLPWQSAGAALLLESDGRDEAVVQAELRAMEGICRDRGATGIFLAEGEEDWKRHWKIRKQVAWVLRGLSTHTSIEDLAVPMGEVRALVRRIRELERDYSLRIPTFGHLGDGNLHAHPLKEASTSEADWLATLPRLLSDLYRSTAALGGTISGEHGIGNKRRGYLSLVMGPGQIDLMRRIKSALDPNGILNPGKIFEPG